MVNDLEIGLSESTSTLSDDVPITESILEYGFEPPLLLETVSNAEKRDADLIVFPEMFISGYQLQDLGLKKKFLSDVNVSLQEITFETRGGPMILIGAPNLDSGKIYNSYFFIDNGSVVLAAQKYHLPNSDIFDEHRYFNQGAMSKPLNIGNLKVGTPICEDIWYPDVAKNLVRNGANIIIAPNGSPYSRGKIETRHKLVISRAKENKVPFIYLNLVGGQDDQVFDGGSFVVNSQGKLICLLPQFEEAIFMLNFEDGIINVDKAKSRSNYSKDEHFEDYRAMCLALKDYVQKSCIFPRT